MVKVFFSYATKDKYVYHIPRLAELLKAKQNIEEVFYWEESASGSIIDYMNEYVKASDTCVFFYSKNAANSEAVKRERDMAIYQGKHIIPVFIDINDVPDILQIETGVNSSNKSKEQVAEQIYRLISLQFGGIEESKNGTEGLILTVQNLLQKRLHASLADLSNDIKTDPKLIKLILDTYAVHYKDSDQFWTNFKELPESIKSFRGTEIAYYEIEILLELEDYMALEYNQTKKFELVEEIEITTQMGFTVENNRITGIGLYDCKINTLPESIGFLVSLQTLGLDKNKLTSLPFSIKQLTSLKRLFLDSNRFETIPASLNNLISLQEIYLSHNQITTLSESIKDHKELQILDLGNNNLRVIVPESLENLVSLVKLRLSYNELTSIPDTIGYLSQVELIELDNNPLETLPKSMVNLKSLRVLFLINTKIKKIPAHLQNTDYKIWPKGQLSIINR
ncbi:MAG: leucine-rich repeat domain-containing protein [Promethearchaeota archaeon]